MRTRPSPNGYQGSCLAHQCLNVHVQYFSIFPGFHAAPLIPVSASKAITRAMPVAAYHSFHMHNEKKKSTRQPITHYNFRWLMNIQNHGGDFSSQPATSLAIPLFVKSRWTVVLNLVLQQISDGLLSITTEFSTVTFSRTELDPSHGIHYKINAQYMHLRRKKNNLPKSCMEATPDGRLHGRDRRHGEIVDELSCELLQSDLMLSDRPRLPTTEPAMAIHRSKIETPKPITPLRVHTTVGLGFSWVYSSPTRSVFVRQD